MEIKKNSILSSFFSFSCFLENQQKEKVLVLMRGVSGSGKSTLAKKIHATRGGVIFSTDDFFTNPATGQYEFDLSKLKQNHEANQFRTAEAMARGLTPIIVDNTNSKRWEMLPYVKMADRYGYRIEIVQPGDPDFPKLDIEEIMQRQAMRGDQNKSLPEKIVRAQSDRFEHDVDVDSIRASER